MNPQEDMKQPIGEYYNQPPPPPYAPSQPSQQQPLYAPQGGQPVNSYAPPPASYAPQGDQPLNSYAPPPASYAPQGGQPLNSYVPPPASYAPPAAPAAPPVMMPMNQSTNITMVTGGGNDGGGGNLLPGMCSVCRLGKIKKAPSCCTWFCCILGCGMGLIPGIIAWYFCYRQPKCENCGFSF